MPTLCIFWLMLHGTNVEGAFGRIKKAIGNNRMALQSITYDLSVGEALDKVQASREHLQKIINEIQVYLSNYGNNWLFFTIGKSHYYKCFRSWARVNNHLEKFLNDPKNNYSLLMTVIDHELAKFHPHSFYAKKVIELQRLIVSGLLFLKVP